MSQPRTLPRYIFLVSHMRSYSTLLGHLLAETAAIDGYSELHQTYETESDLARMSETVRATYQDPLVGSCLFDKILHRAYTISRELCERDDIAIVFSIRTPAATLASMVALGQRDESVSWAAEPSQALLHYQRRLSDISELAGCAPNAALLVADAVVDDTRKTLDRLQDFLGIGDRIPEQYSMRLLTGERRYGDSSPAIRSGTIHRSANSGTEMSELPPGVLSAGEHAFAGALADPALQQLHRIDALA